MSAGEGYAMAALLVSLGIMAVLMTVAMPTWRLFAQREKEEELIFRGKQYARAVGLFQRKYANAFPPNVDLLVEQKFLRKKYKDPMTDVEFQLLYQSVGQQPPGVPGGPPGAAGRRTPGPQGPAGAQRPAISSAGPGAPRAGIIGVVSKSKAKSIRLYNGRDHYNEWSFVYTTPIVQPGGAPGSQRPGQRPAPPGRPPASGGAPPPPK